MIEFLVPVGAAAGLLFVLVRRHRGKSAVAHPDVDPELALNPLTGAPLARAEKAPTSVALDGPAPAPRAPTHHLPPTLAGAIGDVGTAPHVPSRPAAVSLSNAQRTELIEHAIRDRDVESLTAQASVDDPSRLACLVLAGHIGRELGDPRAEHWLYQAFLTGEDPSTDTLLAPHHRALRFRCWLPAWGVDAHWPATREGLGVSVAAEEIRTGDVDSAYGVLLDLADSGAVCALRAAVAVDLRWWSRAVRASRSAGGAWEPLARTAKAKALARKGSPGEARDELTWVIDILTTDPDTHARTGGPTLRNVALFERADALRALGEVDAAWADLTALMAADPSFPGAAEALKSL